MLIDVGQPGVDEYGLADLDGWNPVKAVKSGAKAVGKAAVKTVKTVAKPVTAPVATAKKIGNVAKAVGTAMAKAPVTAVDTGLKATTSLAKTAGTVAGKIALAPTKIALSATKGIVGGGLSLFKKKGGGGSSASPEVEAVTSEPSTVTDDTAAAAAEVARKMRRRPFAAKAAPTDAASASATGVLPYTTTPSPGSGIESTSSPLTLDTAAAAEAADAPQGMWANLPTPAKVAIVAGGGALVIYLGYRFMKRRRGGRGPKS